MEAVFNSRPMISGYLNYLCGRCFLPRQGCYSIDDGFTVFVGFHLPPCTFEPKDLNHTGPIEMPIEGIRDPDFSYLCSTMPFVRQFDVLGEQHPVLVVVQRIVQLSGASWVDCP